jgi:hypothetical protein
MKKKKMMMKRKGINPLSSPSLYTLYEFSQALVHPFLQLADFFRKFCLRVFGLFDWIGEEINLL